MFFITNHESNIIAADADFLNAVSAESLFDALTLIKSGDIKLDEHSRVATYAQQTSSFSRVELQSCLGEATLYQLDTFDTKEESSTTESILQLHSSDTPEPMSAEHDNSPSDKILELISKNKQSRIEEVSVVDEVPLVDLSAPTMTESEDSDQIDMIDEMLESKDLFTLEEKSDEEPILDILGDIDNHEDELSLVDEPIEPEEKLVLDESTLDILGDIGIQDDEISLADTQAPEILATPSTPTVETPIEDELLLDIPSETDDTTEDKSSDEIDPYDNLDILGDFEDKKEEIAPVEESVEPKIDMIEPDSLIDIDDEGTDSAYDNLTILNDEEDTQEPLDTQEPEKLDDILPDTLDVDTQSTEEEVVEEKVEDTTIYNIDVAEAAELIGIPDYEYLHFLNDFFDESKNFEADLRSNDLMASREAASSLKEASSLLQLPHLSEKLEELDSATSDEKSSIIDEYMSLVGRTKPQEIQEQESDTLAIVEDTVLEIEDDIPVVPAVQEQVEEDVPHNKPLEIVEPTDILEISAAAEILVPVQEELLELVDDDIPAPLEQEITPPLQEEVLAEAPVNKEPISYIDLDTVSPIPFDFSIKEAADELTLPESLIAEFVHDFIDQAKENLPVLQDAYNEKNIDKIEKTAHLLKGASSNLRIVPMADTLLDLQSNLEIELVPELIDLFAGQLKSLINQMK